MMRRWRSFARVAILAVLLFFALTASAAGLALAGSIDLFQPGSAGHILAMVFSVIMGLLAFAGAFNKLLVMPVMEKMRAEQRESMRELIGELGEGFDALMERHVLSNDPHPTASDRMHVPLYEADQKILAVVGAVQADVAALRSMQMTQGRRLTALVKAHNVAMSTQRTALDALACVGHRDPKASPFPRRGDDPPDADYTGKRGHAQIDPLLIEEEDDDADPILP